MRDSDLDRHDLVGEAALLPRPLGELLAAKRVAILLLARHAVFRGAVLGRARHRAAAVGVEQRGPERVLELPLSEPQAAAQAANDVRRLAHALGPAGQDDVRFTELDHLAAADGRLNARSAQAVHRQGRHLDRHAGLEPDVTRAVDGVGARLQHVAEDDVIDHARARRRVRSIAARAAIAPRSSAEKSFSLPVYSAIGVRAPPRM